MPTGKGSYGRQVGRPSKKKKESAREAAIRRGGKKDIFSKFIGKMMTGKASPHTDRDESLIGKLMRDARKYEKLMKKLPKRTGKAAKQKKG